MEKKRHRDSSSDEDKVLRKKRRLDNKKRRRNSSSDEDNVLRKKRLDSNEIKTGGGDVIRGLSQSEFQNGGWSEDKLSQYFKHTFSVPIAKSVIRGLSLNKLQNGGWSEDEFSRYCKHAFGVPIIKHL